MPVAVRPLDVATAMGRSAVRGHFSATPTDLVGLTYYDPPGGTHQCLNSKVAACTIVVERRGRPPRTLSTSGAQRSRS